MSRYLHIKLLEILGLEIFDGLWDPWDAEAVNDELKNCDITGAWVSNDSTFDASHLQRKSSMSLG
jgi:hypothetical protein